MVRDGRRQDELGQVGESLRLLRRYRRGQARLAPLEDGEGGGADAVSSVIAMRNALSRSEGGVLRWLVLALVRDIPHHVYAIRGSVLSCLAIFWISMAHPVWYMPSGPGDVSEGSFWVKTPTILVSPRASSISPIRFSSVSISGTSIYGNITPSLIGMTASFSGISLTGSCSLDESFS